MCVGYALCVATCMAEDAATNAETGECNNFGSSAKNCAAACLLGPLGRAAKWAKKVWDKLPCAINSFPENTLVHVKPDGATQKDAKTAKAVLKPISELKVGDEVLALSEWKDKGVAKNIDARLTYEKVVDVFTSYKQQTLVYLALSNGETLAATEGHPFKTTEGWHEAILLKKGGQLDVKGKDGTPASVTIQEVKHEQRTLKVDLLHKFVATWGVSLPIQAV